MLDTLDDLKVADQKGRILLGSRYAGKRFVLRNEDNGTTVLTPVAIVPDNNGVLTTSRLEARFSSLAELRDNWDGYNSPAPKTPIIDFAREVMALLQATAIARGLPWIEPHIASNERGQITLEWWHGERTLTLIVRSEEQVDYLKAWGKDIQDEMEDGEVRRLSDFTTLSRWLYQETNV